MRPPQIRGGLFHAGDQKRCEHFQHHLVGLVTFFQPPNSVSPARLAFPSGSDLSSALRDRIHYRDNASILMVSKARERSRSQLPASEQQQSSPQKEWSGRRDSNPRHQPWQGCTLPTELRPHRLATRKTTKAPLHGQEGFAPLASLEGASQEASLLSRYPDAGRFPSSLRIVRHR
jgi:hypothetical protein